MSPAAGGRMGAEDTGIERLRHAASEGNAAHFISLGLRHAASGKMRSISPDVWLSPHKKALLCAPACKHASRTPVLFCMAQCYSILLTARFRREIFLDALFLW